MLFLLRLPPLLLRSAFVVAVVVIFVLAMIPLTGMPVVFSFQDKVEHCVAFLVLMIMGWAAWPGRTVRIAGGLVAYGLLIEVAQSTLTATRVGDPWDWLADSVGVGIGWMLAKWLASRPGSMASI